MQEAHFQIPTPVNEPVLPYSSGEKHRQELEAELKKMRSAQLDVPAIIGGKEVRSGKTAKLMEPHQHSATLGQYHQADAALTNKAIESAVSAQKGWASLAWQDRAAVFLKAAELLAGKYRPILNAATMLGQSKTAHQAEIDAACELIDFFRFNSHFIHKIYGDQPINSPGIWNRSEYRPLEGFVVAISPFNFTSIAANLCASPALMGNTVVWKPAATAVYSGYFIMKLLEEAGLPPGVINFIPGPSSEIAPQLWQHKDLAGVHFTGSTEVFHDIWKKVGNNIGNYRGYPRLVGETGGKDFVFIHQEADPVAAATALTRGAFEYQGQKCSAASRAYISKSLWPKVKEVLSAQVNDIKIGDPTDFRNFMGAVIDERSFDKLKGAIDRAKSANDTKIILGGQCSKEKGYFIHPTVIETTNPKYETMVQELFGPVLTVYIYDDKDFEKTLELCDQSTPYALTGAFFSQNRQVIAQATDALRFAAGNFYINDKPTGAVVGQQPFGGARASGTNDKAGSVWNLIRWCSPRTIKETLIPPHDYRYPYMS